jgi:hypothetical protein
VSVVAFDTLKFAQTLRDKAKFTPEQAEGLSEAFAQASGEQLATKSDIVDVRADIEALRLSTKADIAGVRADIEALRLTTKADIEALRLSAKTDLAEVKAEILKWMFGTIGFQTVVILGAVFALSRFGH